MKVICEACGEEIGHGQSYAHKVIGWVEVKNGKASGNVVKPSAPLGYAHKICLQTRKMEEGPSLF